MGRKYPKLWMMFPVCSIQKENNLRKLRSRRRADVLGAGGMRGLTKGRARVVVRSLFLY